MRRLTREVEAAQGEALRAKEAGKSKSTSINVSFQTASSSAVAAAAQAVASPEPPAREREMQELLSTKDRELSRLNARLDTLRDQAADAGRLECELQLEKDRVTDLQSEVQELQKQLQRQQEETKAQNIQVCHVLIFTIIPRAFSILFLSPLGRSPSYSHALGCAG